MFFMQKSHLGLGMALGMMAGAAVVSGCVMAMPQGRCMARSVLKKGKRAVKKTIGAVLDN